MVACQAGTFDPAKPIDQSGTSTNIPPDSGTQCFIPSLAPSGPDRRHFIHLAGRTGVANYVAGSPTYGNPPANLTWTELADTPSTLGVSDTEIYVSTAPNPNPNQPNLGSVTAADSQGSALVHFSVNPAPLLIENPIRMVI